MQSYRHRPREASVNRQPDFYGFKPSGSGKSYAVCWLGWDAKGLPTGRFITYRRSLESAYRAVVADMGGAAGRAGYIRAFMPADLLTPRRYVRVQARRRRRSRRRK